MVEKHCIVDWLRPPTTIERDEHPLGQADVRENGALVVCSVHGIEAIYAPGAWVRARNVPRRER